MDAYNHIIDRMQEDAMALLDEVSPIDPSVALTIFCAKSMLFLLYVNLGYFTNTKASTGLEEHLCRKGE
tara:strand:+ start:380 stop:586 length:207 start_codon:yes stop_codon:yes gene_type:complete